MEHNMNHKHEGGATCQSAGCEMKGGCMSECMSSGCACMNGGCMSGCGSFWSSRTFIFIVGLILGMIIVYLCCNFMMRGDRMMWKMDHKMMKGEDMKGEDKMMEDMKMPNEMTK